MENRKKCDLNELISRKERISTPAGAAAAATLQRGTRSSRAARRGVARFVFSFATADRLGENCSQSLASDPSSTFFPSSIPTFDGNPRLQMARRIDVCSTDHEAHLVCGRKATPFVNDRSLWGTSNAERATEPVAFQPDPIPANGALGRH